MIGRIAGRLEYRAADHVLIDVRGVVVREDVLQLFGFSTLVEKEWHRLLMSVQGIGAKASMAILGGLGADGVSRAIALGDWAAVATAKGVGPKTAKKVILDLKDKAHSVMAMAGTTAAPAAGGGASADADAEHVDVLEPTTSIAPDGAAQADALSALGNLGYGPSDAASAVAQAAGENEGADASTLIRAALKLLAPKG